MQSLANIHCIETCEKNVQQSDNKVIAKNNRKNLFKSNEQPVYNFHAGILIFSFFFQALTEKGLGYIKQWLVAILLGSQNIEQTKVLNYSSLQAIVGNVLKHPNNQRTALRKMSIISNREAILRFNGEMIDVTRQRDFYYDPHTKHYTGQLKILDTWCPGVRLADKGINMDFIHTSDGYPVYFDTTDNFYDLRERFMKNMKYFRSLMGFSEEVILTTIIDRGIYSMDVFSEIILSPNQHIITWEKGYNNDKWKEDMEYSTGSIIKTRNCKKDKRLVNYTYQEGFWENNSALRQIIVRVKDKNWDTLIEVSILTDDMERDAKEVIELMLKRWVQENDFKYLIKHFGINEITTYAFVDYKDLQDKIEDKLYTCGNYKKLTKQIQRIRTKLKTMLLRKHKFQQKHPNPAEKLSKNEEDRKRKIWLEVEQLDTALKQYEQQRKELIGKTSKIEELIKEDYKKLDTDTKSFMDAIKVLARNMFYLSLLPFKEKYDNYRDDHVLFRNFTRANGKIYTNDNEVIVELMPTMEYPPKIKRIFREILNNINEMELKWHDNSEKKMILKLDD